VKDTKLGNYNFFNFSHNSFREKIAIYPLKFDLFYIFFFIKKKNSL